MSMRETDSRIRAAARELSLALSEGARDYSIQIDRADVTRIEDEDQRFAYTVHVIEHSERRLAP